MVTLKYFPKELIELENEICKHPRLVEVLNNQPNLLFEVRLAEIAAYCGIVLDGIYDEEQICKLCDLMIMKLKQENSQLVLPF